MVLLGYIGPCGVSLMLDDVFGDSRIHGYGDFVVVFMAVAPKGYNYSLSSQDRRATNDDENELAPIPFLWL